MSAALHPWLVADIGGTNARFGLVRAPEASVEEIVTLKCADFPTPETAARAYLERVAPDGAVRPQRAALALASAIQGDTVKMTNSPWTVSRTGIAAALGARQVLLLNDFEALALALPLLGDEASGELRWIGAPRANRALPMAVIGPGTGLGVAGCVPACGGWVAVAAEGGHVTASPADDFESEVLRVLRIEYRHVSAERVLSGIGLPLLHRAVSRLRGGPDETLTAEEITRRAREQREPHCVATLDTFCAMLGGFAGNVALTLGARGGVFVAGGIAQKLGDDFVRSRFRERFEAKGRFDSYLSRIATALVTAPHPALHGAAQALRQSQA
jgi:glucokinase